MAEKAPSFNSQGTVKGAKEESFNADGAAELLKRSFKGLGTDERTIIRVLAGHNNQQRQFIRKTYGTVYGKELDNDLEDELGGHFLDLCHCLITPPHRYDAILIAKSLSESAEEDCLCEILCTRTNAELELIKRAYYQEFHRDLEKETFPDFSDEFARLMTAVLCNNRLEENIKPLLSNEALQKLAKQDAEKLTAAGVAKIGKVESLYKEIFCVRSWRQLRAVCSAYKKAAGRDIEVDIRKAFGGAAEDMRDALMTIVKVAKNRPAYFAERLAAALNAVDTDDGTLIRIVVSRSEIDLEQIKQEYQRRYKKSVPRAVRDDCDGDYSRLLLKIIGE